MSGGVLWVSKFSYFLNGKGGSGGEEQRGGAGPHLISELAQVLPPTSIRQLVLGSSVFFFSSAIDCFLVIIGELS